MTRRKRAKGHDPFDRACTACGAEPNKPCDTRGKNSTPLVSRASRLVHAARLEGEMNA